MSDGTMTDGAILALPGSLRKGSFNRLLLMAAAECAPAGMEISIYGDLGAVPLFNEDVDRATNGGPDGVSRLREKVSSADGLLIATPEYNQSVPGVLKNAVDWLSRPAPEEVLVGKPIAIMGATSGRWGTRLAQSHLRHVLYAAESLVLPAPALFVRDAADLFDASGRLTDPSTRASLTKLLASFADWIVRCEPGRPTRGRCAVQGVSGEAGSN